MIVVLSRYSYADIQFFFVVEPTQVARQHYKQTIFGCCFLVFGLLCRHTASNSGSFQAGISPEPGPGFEWGTVTKWCDVKFSSHFRHIPGSIWRCQVLEKVFFSTSKNLTIFLDLGTNVTISSHRHIIFLGSAWNKTEFQNLARSWVLGSRFSNSGLEWPSITADSFVLTLFIFKALNYMLARTLTERVV